MQVFAKTEPRITKPAYYFAETSILVCRFGQNHFTRKTKKAASCETAFGICTVSQLLAELCEVLDCSYHLRCVRILVVVPGNNLNE